MTLDASRATSSAAPAIGLGAYADLLGRTWRQDEAQLARELAERNLAVGDWANARAFWTRAVEEDVARGGTELVLAFAARFEAARRVQPPASPLPSTPSPPTAAETPVATETPAPSVAVPSYLAAPPPVSIGARPEPPLPVPRAPVSSPPATPAPVPSGPPATPVHPPLVPPPSRSKLAGTALASGAPAGPATPFVAAKAQLPDGLREYAALTAELAFDPQRAAEVLARHRLTPAAKDALDAQWQAKLSRNAMSSLQFPRLVEQERVRLRELRGAPVNAPASSAPRSKSSLGSTAFARPEAVRESIEKAALPFAGRAEPARAQTKDLTLAHYASLCVELAVAPERRTEILRRYGMSGDAEHAELERIWADRLAEDPAQSAEFHAAVQSYRTWLLRK